MTLDDLELLHCVFQELEQQGADLVLADYTTIYYIIETEREIGLHGVPAEPTVLPPWIAEACVALEDEAETD